MADERQHWFAERDYMMYDYLICSDPYLHMRHIDIYTEEAEGIKRKEEEELP